jgi:hypothetical protein
MCRALGARIAQLVADAIACLSYLADLIMKPLKDNPLSVLNLSPVTFDSTAADASHANRSACGNTD